jgi:hypothetical protein
MLYGFVLLGADLFIIFSAIIGYVVPKHIDYLIILHSGE